MISEFRFEERLKQRPWCFVCAATCMVFLGSGGVALAGGFYSPYQSATGMATAFAGASARSDDASFFLYNPATVSGLDGTQSYVDLRGFAPTAQIKPCATP